MSAPLRIVPCVQMRRRAATHYLGEQAYCRACDEAYGDEDEEEEDES